MRKLSVLVLSLVAVAFAASANGCLQAEGVSGGSTVLRFQGSDVTTTFSGMQEMSGSLLLDDVSYPFVATGSAYGLGVGSAETLAVSLWVLFRVEGTVDGVDPITIRGGMDVVGDGIDVDSFSLGSGSGTFLVVVEFMGVAYEFAGSVESTGAGTLVPPQDPSTMEVAGTVASTLEGTLYTPEGELVDRIPWDAAAWPTELHEQLMTLLLTGVMPEPPSEEPAPEPEERPSRGRGPVP